MTEVQRAQAQQADAALEEFKRQVEVNSEKIYAEMKEQVRHTHLQKDFPFKKLCEGLRMAQQLKHILPLQRT